MFICSFVILLARISYESTSSSPSFAVIRREIEGPVYDQSLRIYSEMVFEAHSNKSILATSW